MEELVNKPEELYAGKPIRQLYNDARNACEKAKSLDIWRKYGYEDMSVWQADRLRCQTDLFWFAKEVLGYHLVECHRLITTDFFVKKDPSVKIEDLSTVKSRLVLYPRGSFKSSIDEADTVQWIVTYPNIRIALLTATDKLGIAFVSKVKSFFQISEQVKLTQFQMLFFEHCVSATKREAEEMFMTRARTTILAQPTLEALSIKAGTSGLHYDVGKFDDVVSNQNSGPGSSADQREIIYQAIRFAAALIDPFGYKFYIGTPYNDDDAWSYLQEKTLGLVVLKAPALKIKPHAIRKPFLELEDEDVDLLFPYDALGRPRLTLGFLKGEYHAEEYVFSCNYLLDPARTRTVRFTEELLRSRVTQESGLPQPGTYRVFSAWDFADSTGKDSDYSVGTVGMLDVLGRLFVVEVLRGKFSPSELAFKVADQAARWRVEKIYIEKSPGADFLQNDILRELNRCGYSECPYPEYFPVDNQKGAKEKRRELLESYLTNKLLWFSSALPNFQVILDEFLNTKSSSKRKDDIIDSIAHLARIIPPSADIPKSEIEQSQIVWDVLAQKQLQDMYFGVRENATPQPLPDLPMTTFEGSPVACPHCGFSPCLGA